MDKIENYNTPDHDTMKADLEAIKNLKPEGEEMSLLAWMTTVFRRAEIAFDMLLIDRPTIRDTWILLNSLKMIERNN